MGRTKCYIHYFLHELLISGTDEYEIITVAEVKWEKFCNTVTLY